MEEEEEDDPDVNDRSSPLIFSHRRNWIYVLSLRTTHGKAAAAVESCWAGEEEDRDNDSNQHFILVISGYQRGEIRNEDVFERSAPVSSSPNYILSPEKKKKNKIFILIRMGLIYRPTICRRMSQFLSGSGLIFGNLTRHRKAGRNK